MCAFLLLFVCFGGGDFCVVGFRCCFWEGLLIFPDYTDLKDIFFKFSVQLSFSSSGQTNSVVVSNMILTFCNPCRANLKATLNRRDIDRNEQKSYCFALSLRIVQF